MAFAGIPNLPRIDFVGKNKPTATVYITGEAPRPTPDLDVSTHNLKALGYLLFTATNLYSKSRDSGNQFSSIVAGNAVVPALRVSSLYRFLTKNAAQTNNASREFIESTLVIYHRLKRSGYTHVRMYLAEAAMVRMIGYPTRFQTNMVVLTI